MKRGGEGVKKGHGRVDVWVWVCVWGLLALEERVVVGREAEAEVGSEEEEEEEEE